FTGVDYDASVSTGTAALCDSNGTSGCQALTGTSISTNGSGALTGSGAVPSGATTGARKLVVSTTTQTASTDYLVLGAAAINLSASSGAAGGSVVVSGSNFDPGRTLFVSPTDGTGPTGSVAVVVTSATGTFSGASVTTNTGTVAITATVNPPDGINLASQPFTVSANSCVAVAAGGTTGSCSISQTLQETITGGELKMSQSAGLVALSGTTLNGTNQTATGSLNQVTVTDSRGTLGGWTLTGNVTDLTTGVGADANHTLPAASITWTPACAATTGTSAEVAPGAAGGIASATLCQAAAGGGGGVFTADAGISVPVPATKAAGLYSGTLTLTLTGL
ncbi:MAG TPA: WxL domain-containing protein, partial [Acidimicrobiales bacterium]